MQGKIKGNSRGNRGKMEKNHADGRSVRPRFVEPMLTESTTAWIRLLFASYRRATGRVLWDPDWAGLPDDELARAVEEAPCVIASHRNGDDPVLNYGNNTALCLWEASWEEFTRMPSRLTAEPLERSERERLLAEVTSRGYIDNYSGIRISTTGKRFRIHRATVWNVMEEENTCVGQAVIFSDWEPLPPVDPEGENQ